MADELDVLLDKVTDPSLRAQLRAEIDKVRAKRTFGLVFESHLPERVMLPEHPIRRGARVVSRGDKKAEPMRVSAVRRGQATVELADGTTDTAPVADLVVVAEFGEPVHPGLVRLGSLNRGGDKPAHMVINAENHHALEMLQFTHAGKVDCIYIDPPYNTGAKDWKYDNNYVDNDDAYRHSKWLAFMERRLLLAKQLLNPDNSALIVTIDEKEYLRLGLLLQQTFASARQMMVTSSINNAGVTRIGTFARSAEYIYVVQIGASEVSALTLGDEWNPVQTKNKASLYWNRAIRNGENGRRVNRPNLFYPIFIRNSSEGPVFDSVGEPFYGAGHEVVQAPLGAVAVWPIRQSGEHGTWQVEVPLMRRLIDEHAVRLGEWRDEQTTVYYLKTGERQKVAEGRFPVIGYRADGSVVVDGSEYESTFVPTDVWRISSHDAGNSGSRLVQQFIPGRRFPFPKSLYAVEDALRFFVADKPEAVIVDFFAGSGTTAHAVMRLNRQDAGRRQAIVVTNNEVSADEAKALTERGFRDGDQEWEALGIFEHITRPRVTAAVTGLTPDGSPIKGDYKFTDEFPMAEGFEENVEFLKLTYLDPVDVELDRAFEAVAPLLWMRAGGQGAMVERRCDAEGEPLPFAVAERYGVLFDPDEWRQFVQVLPDTARTVFVVTDSAAVFAGVAEQLPEGLEPVRLYENYLTTFAINRGGGS